MTFRNSKKLKIGDEVTIKGSSEIYRVAPDSFLKIYCQQVVKCFYLYRKRDGKLMDTYYFHGELLKV